VGYSQNGFGFRQQRKRYGTEEKHVLPFQGKGKPKGRFCRRKRQLVCGQDNHHKKVKKYYGGNYYEYG
jgi:hypothetical protein